MRKKPPETPRPFTLVPLGLVLLLLFSFRVMFTMRRLGGYQAMYSTFILVTLTILLIGVTIFLTQRRKK